MILSRAMKQKGLITEVDGEICMKIRFSSDTDIEYDIPIGELLEEFIGKRVQIKVLPLKAFEEAEFE